MELHTGRLCVLDPYSCSVEAVYHGPVARSRASVVLTPVEDAGD